VKKILFVCTGNSCRSVMAQGLLRKILKEQGRDDVQILSAGVSTLGGLGATEETIEVMQRESVDVSGHISQPLTRDLVRSAEAIFCMEEFHKELILARSPDAARKVHLLRPFEHADPDTDPNIPDPIGHPKQVYESCLMTIKEAVERVARWLEKK
jgi:protein-tyrosine-phosphatase